MQLLPAWLPPTTSQNCGRLDTFTLSVLQKQPLHKNLTSRVHGMPRFINRSSVNSLPHSSFLADLPTSSEVCKRIYLGMGTTWFAFVLVLYCALQPERSEAFTLPDPIIIPGSYCYIRGVRHQGDFVAYVSLFDTGGFKDRWERAGWGRRRSSTALEATNYHRSTLAGKVFRGAIAGSTPSGPILLTN